MTTISAYPLSCRRGCCAQGEVNIGGHSFPSNNTLCFIPVVQLRECYGRGLNSVSRRRPVGCYARFGKLIVPLKRLTYRQCLQC